MSKKKEKVTNSDVMDFIRSLPENCRIPLKSGDLIQLYPNDIIEEINERTETGKKYYLRIAKAVMDKKKKRKME